MDWLQDFRRAVFSNLADPEVVELAHKDPRTLPELVAVVRAWLPYGFAGPDWHRIMSLQESAARGSWACADAAAFFAAVALLRRAASLSLCVEQHPDDDSYSHVRMVVDGAVLEPWPERRWEVPACSGRVDVRKLVGR